MRYFHRAPVVLFLAALLAALSVSFAAAQIQPNTFKHIIIIVQENRTPDNIFGSYGPASCGGTANFPGADIRNSGAGGPPCNVVQAMNAQPTNGTTFDPGHEYEDWHADYDNGNMDGFCHGLTGAQCTAAPTPYSYIQPSDVGPYFSIATTYGFANYMFQTSEGPSFPAHQFLFTGTSAPVAPNDSSGYHWDFVRDNPPNNSEFETSGCPYDATGGYPPAPWIQPDRTYPDTPLPPYECYPHDSLVTTSDPNTGDVIDKIPSWTYYSPLEQNGNGQGIIWDAPEAIPEICYGVNNTSNVGTVCGGTEWNAHMSFYDAINSAPILSDIASCKLASISWVIPDLAWSDHPFSNVTGAALGPSWVADIVNAIGQSYSNNPNCDYWGTSGAGGSVVQPTAVFIVWDDWGGFYDHITPLNIWTGSRSGNNWSCPAPNQWGCGYTYGFRVPFLVVSEFTGTYSSLTKQYSGYISGPCTPPACPNTNPIYQHDFGSILAFAEHNFELSQIAPPAYADANALDNYRGNLPLSDFFSLWTNSNSVGRPFVQMPTDYPASFFQGYYATYGATPTGPDTD